MLKKVKLKNDDWICSICMGSAEQSGQVHLMRRTKKWLANLNSYNNEDDRMKVTMVS